MRRAPRARVFKASDVHYRDGEPPLGSGSYGTVRMAELDDPTVEGGRRPVVVKETKEDAASVEYGEVEVYMNKRLCDKCSEYMATFLGHFRRHIPHSADATLPEGTAPSGQTVGLVWALESTTTLDVYIKEGQAGLERLERLMLGAVADDWDAEERRVRLVREVASRLFAALAAFHEEDVVHRDVKPSNVLVLPDSSFRFIDFGCAADMVTYIGYDPRRGPGAPAYRAPEEFVSNWMPDRFDVYPVGIIVLQLVFEHLRTEEALLELAAELRLVSWDLDKWLQGQLLHSRAERLRTGLAVLNRDEAAAWDLLRRVITQHPRSRISASAALAEHRYLRGGPKLGPFSFLGWARPRTPVTPPPPRP